MLHLEASSGLRRGADIPLTQSLAGNPPAQAAATVIGKGIGSSSSTRSPSPFDMIRPHSARAAYAPARSAAIVAACSSGVGLGNRTKGAMGVA